MTVEIERFLDELGDEAREPDRALATVLSTRVVTPGAAEGEELAGATVPSCAAICRASRGQELDAADGGMRASFDGPARAIRCACAVLDAAEAQMDVRAGLHTGECELVNGRPQGVAVEIAAGVAGQAGPGEALVSSTVRDLVAGSGLRFAERGTLWPAVTGDAGALRLFAVVR